jgi:hypothetical protein
MIGDIILWIKDFLKNIFCIHNYEYNCLLKRCKKCGRIK